MTEINFVTLNIRILRVLFFIEGYIFKCRVEELGLILDHLEVDLWNVRANYASAAAVDEGVVAFSFVLVLDEPERRMQICGLVNTEASVELGYLIHFLSQEESLVFLNLILCSYDRLIAV
jgi:hypothetical protein